MRPLKMVMVLPILFIASARGFFSHEIDMNYQKSTKSNEIETGPIHRFPRGVGLGPIITYARIQPPLISTLQNRPPPRKFERGPVMSSQLSMTTESRLSTPTIITSELPTTGGEDIKAESFRPRNRRALRIPPLRIPSLARVRPQVSVPRSPGAGSRPAQIPKGGSKLGAGSPPVSSPKREFTPGAFGGDPTQGSPARGGSKSGSFGAGGRPQADDRSRRKGGSKGSGSFPDLDDIPSPGEWSDFFGGNSAGKDSEKSNEEETANKTTTTERNSNRWDGGQHFHPEGPHFHPEGPGHFPDYGWHGW